MCVVCGEHAAENLQTDQSIMPSSLLEFSVLYGVYMTHTNHFMLEHHIQAVQNPGEGGQRQLFGQWDGVGLAQSEVYTHIGCSVALKGAAIDVECFSIVVDGPCHSCSVALKSAAIDVECPIVVDGPSLVSVEFSTWCCRSVCSSVAHGG